MIEVIDAERDPFDCIDTARRYFVVFWCDRPEGLTEIQTLVRSTENDVAEVLTWATREMSNPEIGAKCFQLFVVVEPVEDVGAWLVRLSGPDDLNIT